MNPTADNNWFYLPGLVVSREHAEHLPLRCAVIVRQPFVVCLRTLKNGVLCKKHGRVKTWEDQRVNNEPRDLPPPNRRRSFSSASPQTPERRRQLEEYKRLRPRLLRNKTCAVYAALTPAERAQVWGVSPFASTKSLRRRLPPVADQLHHVRGRRHRLLTDERYIIAVCSEGHQWIHQHPARAIELGLLCPRGLWGVREPEPKSTK